MLGVFKCKLALHTPGRAGGDGRWRMRQMCRGATCTEGAECPERGSNATGASLPPCGAAPMPYRCREMPARLVLAWARGGGAARVVHRMGLWGSAARAVHRMGLWGVPRGRYMAWSGGKCHAGGTSHGPAAPRSMGKGAIFRGGLYCAADLSGVSRGFKREQAGHPFL